MSQAPLLLPPRPLRSMLSFPPSKIPRLGSAPNIAKKYLDDSIGATDTHSVGDKRLTSPEKLFAPRHRRIRLYSSLFVARVRAKHDDQAFVKSECPDAYRSPQRCEPSIVRSKRFLTFSAGVLYKVICLCRLPCRVRKLVMISDCAPVVEVEVAALVSDVVLQLVFCYCHKSDNSSST